MRASYTDRPLSEEEMLFAEKHHDLMYRYMILHKLDVEEWYDILIIPYLQAVKKYHEYERLNKLKFEQVFFRTLDNARSNYWRDLNRKKRCPDGGIWSIEGMHSDKLEDIEQHSFPEIIADKMKRCIDDVVTDRVYTEDLINELEEDQLKEIVYMLMNGYTRMDVLKMLHISEGQYYRRLRDIRDIILMCTR